MRAAIITEFGDPNVFKSVEIAKPQLSSGTVLIKVKASSVNPIDCKIRSGAVANMAPDFPAILHGDVTGIVEEVGEGVTRFKPGDEVFGFAGGVKGCSGALAEYMLVDSQLLAKKPRVLPFNESAALPLVAITAWEALFTKAHLTKDHSVLIHGGAGGVGHVAVQLAKWCGAKVFTTIVNPNDIPLMESYHVDGIILVKEEDVPHYVKRLTNGEGFDIVFDTVGGANLERSFAATKLAGTVVTTAARSTLDLTIMHNKGLSLHVVFTLLPLITGMGRAHFGKMLEHIAELVDEKKLIPKVDVKKFTLDTVNEAHAWFEGGNAKGKVIVVIA